MLQCACRGYVVRKKADRLVSAIMRAWADSAYQEMERERFAALESKARSDKNVMMSRLLHAAYVGVSESLCDAMVESPVGSFVQHAPLLPGLLVSWHTY